MTYLHNYSGKSLLELREQFGIGSKGFYDHKWYKKESFAKETPPKGIYEIDLGENLTNLTFEEQKKKLKKDFEPIHPAILAEFILAHLQEKGKRLLETKYARTSSVDSDGNRVRVGRFDSDGLAVNRYWDDDRRDRFGLASARKSKKSIESGGLESFESLNLRVEKIEQWINSYAK